MSTLVLQRKEVPRAPVQSPAPLRAQLVGPNNSRTRSLHRRLKNAGMDIDLIDSEDASIVSICQLEVEALFLLVDPARESEELERLRLWRQFGLSFPVIAVTTPDKAAACLDAGADDCVPPTVDERELQARIRAHTRRNGSKSKTVRVLDLEIDPNLRKAARNGREIHLTPREFAILEILASNRGRVVTRMMIWQRLYNETERYASNVVDVYIRYLRQKIEMDGLPTLIQTVWGRGYMLPGEPDGGE